MPIRQLSPLLVSQIAAGEVVERPASIAKELLENTFDAGATRVEIDLEGGGRDLFKISDDGSGIPREDLPLAVAPHATSKIVDLTDLESVSTMGFRGEALASIAAVSRLSITSRAAGCDEAWRMDVEGDSIGDPEPVAAPSGTTIEVRTLFFNTPARRRFLKSERAETARISEVVRTLAISRPGVAIRLRSEGRVLLDLPKEDDPARRIAAVLGEENGSDLVPVHGEIGDPSEPSTFSTVWGLVGRPQTARPTARQQRFILNGRTIEDRSLSHAIKEAFRGLIEPGRHPVAALFIEVDPRTIDVNVHPAKTEIRFRESRSLFSLIRRSIQEALSGEDLVPSISYPETPAQSTPPAESGRTFAAEPRTPSVPGISSAGKAARGGSWAPGFDLANTQAFLNEDIAAARVGTEAAAPLPRLLQSDDVLQLHSSFLVTQDSEGLVVIDQHALHERVMFEKLKSRVEAGDLQSQQLTAPVIVAVDPEAVASVETLEPLLTRLGMDLRPAGPRGVGIHAFPTLLFERSVEPGPFVEELLEHAASGEIGADDVEAALSEVLDMMSCKAAIKAGDRLSALEISELLEMRSQIDRGSNCPHGRPTHLRIPIAEIERRFGRTPRT